MFLRKGDCLGYAVLLCLDVCLTLLASSFLLSSLIKTCTVESSVPLTLLEILGLAPMVSIRFTNPMFFILQANMSAVSPYCDYSQNKELHI